MNIYSLWATLASMSLAKKHLDTVEICLAEVNEIPRVEYIQYIKRIPSEEGRQAELSLFRRQPGITVDYFDISISLFFHSSLLLPFPLPFLFRRCGANTAASIPASSTSRYKDEHKAVSMEPSPWYRLEAQKPRGYSVRIQKAIPWSCKL
jgi:hypothetical protein